jgi:cobalt-zinc-cadmium efflux system protein
MGHDHSHHAHHQNSKNILVAFFLNASFSIIELIGGYYTNSVAIYSDALHDFGDSLALLFSYYAEKLSNKKADRKFTFGYRRFSILSALINGVILLSGSIFVIYEAVQRLISPEVVKPEGMIWLAILGIFVNSVAAYRMSKNTGLNTRMVMLHLLEDLFGWVAVLIVSIILMYKPWFFLDSALSIFISVIILRGVYQNLKKISLIFLQKFPDEIDIETIQKEISSFDLVKDIHAVRGLSLDGEKFYLSLHIQVPKETSIGVLDNLRADIKKILKERNIFTSTVEFESSLCEEGNDATTI